MKKVLLVIIGIFSCINLMGQTWTPKNTLPFSRRDYGLIHILGTDQAVLMGGWADWGARHSTVWIYNMKDNSWVPNKGEPHDYGCDKTSTCYIGDDKIMVYAHSGNLIYDISENAWTRMTPTDSIYPHWDENYGLCYIGDDKVMYCGGEARNDYVTGIEFNKYTWIYDLSENTWQVVDSACPPRSAMQMVYLGDSKVMLYGGKDYEKQLFGSVHYSNDSWIFNLKKNTWTKIAPVGDVKPDANSRSVMTSIGNAQVLLYGGKNNNEVWIFDINQSSWSHVSNIMTSGPDYTEDHSILFNDGGEVCLFEESFDNVWKYNLKDQAWNLQNVAQEILPTGQNDLDMCSFSRDNLLLYGGESKETWIYSLQDNKWTLQTPKDNITPPALRGYSLCSIGNNQVMLLGGKYRDSVESYTNRDTWIYDYSANSWLQRPCESNEVPNILSDQSICLIGNTIVSHGSHYYDSTWIYDLNSNMWSRIEPKDGISPDCYSAVICNIGDDKIVMFGGYKKKACNETWVFDLSERSWTKMDSIPGESYPKPRIYHSMCYLGDDYVMMFGGADINDNHSIDNIFNDTWIYRLSTNKWTKVDASATPPSRFLCAASGFNANGKALILGGCYKEGGLVGYSYDKNASFNDYWLFDYSTYTSVEDHFTPQKHNVKVFPNPADDYVTVNYNCQPGTVKLEIYNLLGNVIQANEFITSSEGEKAFRINVAAIPSGNYLIKLNSNGKVISTILNVVR